MILIEDIIRRINCVIYRLDIILSKTHQVHLLSSKINFFCQKNICSAGCYFIPCQEVEKCHWLILPMETLAGPILGISCISIRLA